jgi:predicted nucleic acid-binding protein
MNIFCDTSVLVASALKSHPHHAAAIAVVLSLRDPANRGYTSAHALFRSLQDAHQSSIESR